MWIGTLFASPPALLERAGMANCPPKLNPKGETIAYQTLLDAWKAGKVR